MNPMSTQNYQEARQQSRILALRMRCMNLAISAGTGVGKIMGDQQSNTHYMDALERFKKDYSAYDRQKREEQRLKRQHQLERKRLEHLQRQNKRWEVVQQTEQSKKQKIMHHLELVNEGRKKTANSNGLPYNPINLTYDKNPQGQKLKLRDQDHKIRSLVRAYNMDHYGNSAYNPINGQQRGGVSNVVPNQLHQRYRERLQQFQEGRRLKLPQSSNQTRKNIYQYY